jgi:hypothetical protein
MKFLKSAAKSLWRASKRVLLPATLTTLAACGDTTINHSEPNQVGSEASGQVFPPHRVRNSVADVVYNVAWTILDHQSTRIRSIRQENADGEVESNCTIAHGLNFAQISQFPDVSTISYSSPTEGNEEPSNTIVFDDHDCQMGNGEPYEDHERRECFARVEFIQELTSELCDNAFKLDGLKKKLEDIEEKLEYVYRSFRSFPARTHHTDNDPYHTCYNYGYENSLDIKIEKAPNALTITLKDQDIPEAEGAVRVRLFVEYKYSPLLGVMEIDTFRYYVDDFSLNISYKSSNPDHEGTVFFDGKRFEDDSLIGDILRNFLEKAGYLLLDNVRCVPLETH